ncbi:ATP-grasp domain-containing protein [Paludisphaera mucosa]|uniref:ATP-grasp domain-containing protein n=1 Tax=Paludisphaera mucosa TaxID=3030827 RepID=A0ABT6F8S2_9BACT|nr:ATP-grasp domain-containing protein [Paludisphaera mucosa]MDG3003917.1 ATP-grasp domain-containing protein [Paludisphaera mucosa]
MPAIESVLIIGASTRAAAFSASRAGLRPKCLELFADADLAAHCPVVRFDPDRDGDDLERLATSLGCEAWFYTGSMECRPDLVERLTRLGRLLGNGPDVLRRVRDPWQVGATLQAAGMPTPALRRASDGPAESGSWLRKNPAVAGGLGVAWADGAQGAAAPMAYLQEFVEGPTFSALFVAAGGDARLLGVARQFRGALGAEFLYRGGVGPWPMEIPVMADVRRLGQVLASEFRLVGLFGIDFIHKNGRPWAVEVNPRYTASVELFEAAMRRAFVADHVRACVEVELGQGPSLLRPTPAFGKRVIYASRRLEFPNVGPPPRGDDDRFQVPVIADLPAPGTVIEAGEPIMTVFATAATSEQCIARLDRRERAWLERLERTT